MAGEYGNPWPGSVAQMKAQWLNKHVGMEFSYLIDAIEDLTVVAKSKINQIRSQRSAMSIADMFDLQMAMNRLGQLSEGFTSVTSAMNTAINSMARNVKG